MKFVLCSEGFHTQNTVVACVKLVGKPQDQLSIGIINEAYAVGEGDNVQTIGSKPVFIIC